MKVSKRKILEQWIDYAKADLDAAKRLLDSKKPTRWTYLLALWHCHQAIEKILKMVIIKKDNELLKIHDLMRLAELAEIEFSEQDFKFLQRLNKYYLRSRYPDLIYDSLANPDKKFTKDFVNRVKEIFLWLVKQ
ncbi:HEPN domain-containing protein [Patescibacteria group bacterium]